MKTTNMNMKETKERKWHGLYVSIGDDWEVFEDVGVYVSDDELYDALEDGEIAEYFAYKVAADFLRFWKEDPNDSLAELFVNLIKALKEEDAYDVYTDEIDEALEAIENQEQDAIAADILGEILVDYTQVYDEGEWDFDEDEDPSECPYEMELYWDGGLVE